MVNYDKSLIYFGANVNDQDKLNVSGALGARVSLNPEKYLGLLMMVGHNKKKAFAQYVDRIQQGLNSWNFRFLSLGGKATLIKAISQAILIYAMRCFLFPNSLCIKIENVLNKF